MDPEFLVGGVLRSVLGGRGKRARRASRYVTRGLSRGMGYLARDVGRLAGSSHRGTGGFLTRPGTLLGALGVAWGIFETLEGPGGQGTGAVAGSGGAAAADAGSGGWAPGTSPAGGAAGAAANPSLTDPPPVPGPSPPGSLAPEVQRMIRLAISAAHADGSMNEHERAAVMRGARDEGVESVFTPEMNQPHPLAEIVGGVTDPAERATLYVLAFTVVRADEQVTGAERIYLAQLANLLGLDAATVSRLETDTGQRIDALGDQGQPGG